MITTTISSGYLRKFIVATAAVALGSAASLSAATLVENGKAVATIITADAPSPAARRAAQILKEHVLQMSGADLPIATESKYVAPASATLILLGDSKLAVSRKMTADGLGAGGFHAESKGDVIALVGTDMRTPTDYWGTTYAVTWFLEEKLGVRYLWPGEMGKVVPAQRTITIADFQKRSVPALAQRQIRSMGYHDRLQVGIDRLRFTKQDYERLRTASSAPKSYSGEWFQWHGLGGSLNVAGGHAFGHLWEKYGKEHPDWFAMQPNGSRDQSISGDRSRLCKSNRGLIDAIAREKIEELNKNPNLFGVSLSPNDGGRSTFCTCPQCEALDAPNARQVQLWDFTGKERRNFEHVSLTDRMVHFWNSIADEVSKAHPEKLLTVDAYSAYTSAPIQRKLHPNLVVRFAALSYEDDGARHQALEDWNAWAKMAKRIYFRSNCMLAGRRTGMPLIYVHRFAEDFRHLAAHSMMGTDLDSCTHNWATQGPNYYVVARLHWDPNRNVDEIIDDYCRAGFGPAAKSMRAYFDKLESVYSGTASRHEESFSGFTDAVLAELKILLAKAATEAADDKESLQRIEFIRVGATWTEIEVKAHRLLNDKVNVDKVAAKQLLDARYALMRQIFEKHPLAVNVAYVSWGEDGLYGQLGWRPSQ